MSQSTEVPDTSIALLANGLMLDDLSIAEKICLAAVLLSLPAKKSRYSLDDVLKSNVTSSQFLTLKVLDLLIKRGLVVLDGKSGRIVRLTTKNDDKTLKRLLDNIRHKTDNVESYNEMKNWLKDTLVAECVQCLCDLASRNGADIDTLETPPEAIGDLLQERSINEVRMLGWRVLTKIGPSDLRLMSLELDESQLEPLVKKVADFNQTYLDQNRSIPPLKYNTDHKLSSLSQIIARYYLDLSNKDFNSNSFVFLSEGV